MEQNIPAKNRRRGIYLLPNLFTTAALFAGFYAITSAMNGHYEVAAVSIFVAMVLDGLDGRVARLTNTQSAFGAEYDSMADMISFGAAPALVMYTWALSQLGKAGWVGLSSMRPGPHCGWHASIHRLPRRTNAISKACPALRRRPSWPASSGFA